MMPAARTERLVDVVVNVAVGVSAARVEQREFGCREGFVAEPVEAVMAFVWFGIDEARHRFALRAGRYVARVGFRGIVDVQRDADL